ncbi:MAG: TIR domain-containing protein [Lachnospiraceae bacterium]|nr:TIR domain-containing protein [Lachnospiraceae bacterium]
MSLENVKYDAFISYRHCELDSFISENLHKKLESYRMPASVIKKLDPAKTKIERVFRDEAELPLSNNLSDPISEALDNSEFLIVICTPRLPQSQWCKKEIETFVETHDRQHVLLVLAEGEPEESFPDILMYDYVTAKDENGNDIKVRVDREPLAADCRGDNNKQRLKALDNVVLKLCAAMFNLNYDDLKQRHRERQIRRRLIAMSAALAIVTVFAVTCLSFIIKISRQNKIISDKYAGAMASASEDLLSRGLRKDAIYAVRNVLPANENKGYNAEAYKALVKGIAPYEVENTYFPSDIIKSPKDARGFSVSEDKSMALINCGGYFTVIDIAGDTELCRIESDLSDSAVFDDTGVTYIDSGLQVKHLDPKTGAETVLADGGFDLYYSPASKVTLVFFSDGIGGYKNLAEDFFIGFADSRDVGPENMIDDPDYLIEDVFITDDGKYAAFAVSGFDNAWYGLIDISEGRFKKCLRADDIEVCCVGTDGKMLYICYEDESDNMDSTEVSIMEALDISSGKTVSCDIPGYGFFNMVFGDNGILLMSDNLSYILDEDLNMLSNITGYTEAVCGIASEEGFMILDVNGRMFTDGVYSGVGKSYSLYGHNDDSRLSHAVYKDDEFFVIPDDTGRLVKYSPLSPAYEIMSDIGDAIPFEYSDMEIGLRNLEGISDISVFFTAVSDDGKYTAVQSNDSVLYIFDTVSGKKIKEAYDTNILLSHKTFPYLKAADVYIIEDGVFDKDFNMISTLPHGALSGIGTDGKSVVINSPYSLDAYYRITLFSYDEMIKRADDILGSYVPAKDICEKYNIN